ncbi:hypothetical protein SAMN02799625_03335 [Methylobacterium sp. UNC300MFChir4.1]|nr:hypothetical protein SAMN02799625_03335 [Methylobacterium sp. UNC300MFChir4.1]
MNVNTRGLDLWGHRVSRTYPNTRKGRALLFSRQAEPTIRTSDLVGATAGVALLGGLCLLLVALLTSEAQGFTDLTSILTDS